MTTATTTRTVYEQLEALSLPHLEHFETDLQTHDADWLERNPGIPFIHMTRSSGTVLVALYPADSDRWPAAGEQIKYLFGIADRWHVLKDSTGIVDCCPEEHTYHYCDGRTVRAITHTQAQDIARQYRRTVSSAWNR